MATSSFPSTSSLSLPSASAFDQHSERTNRIDEIYLVLGYRIWLAPTEVSTLSTRQLDHRGKKPKTHVCSNSPTTFRYEDLPKEVQFNVLTALFRDCRPGQRYYRAVTLWHPCALRRAILVSSRTAIRQDACHLGLCVPEDFVQLFVSQQFLKDALPIFAKHTNIDLWSHSVHHILQALAPYPLLDHIFATFLRKTRSVSVEDFDFCANCNYYAKTLTCWTSNLRKLRIHTEAPLLWKAKTRHAPDTILWDHKYGLKFSTLHTIGYEESLHLSSNLRIPTTMQHRLRKSFYQNDRYLAIKRLAKALRIRASIIVIFSCRAYNISIGPYPVQGSIVARAMQLALTFDVRKDELVKADANDSYKGNSTDRMSEFEQAAAEFLCGRQFPKGVAGGCRNTQWKD